MDDEILIIGCDSDDEIDSTCSDTSSDQLNEGRQKSTPSSEETGGESDARSRKRKREESQERGLTLGEELALTDSDSEGTEVQNETFKKKERKNVEETIAPDTEESKAADIGLAIYSLGNYCPRMLRGVPCTKARCSWVHYMVPSSAVSQLYRILANRNQEEALQFYHYFSNIEIQEQLINDAQESFGFDEPLEFDGKDVCREVLRAMTNISEGMDFDLGHFMDMVEISKTVCTLKKDTDVLVKIFYKAMLLVENCGTREAKESKRLAMWAWRSLYLVSVEDACILPVQFYTDLSSLLLSHKMIPQLVEILLYTSLLPHLSLPLRILADILTLEASLLTSPHSTAVLAGQVLSKLTSEEWTSLASLDNIKPGIETLIGTLASDDPSDVYRFFETVPEFEGLDIPNLPPPPIKGAHLWIKERTKRGDFSALIEKFLNTKTRDVESMAEFTEGLYIELAGVRQSGDPHFGIQFYFHGTSDVIETNSELHKLFWSQLGVSLLLNEVVAAHWNLARDLIELMETRLTVDWLRIRPPGLAQFSCISPGMVTLFVLETLVKQRSTEALVRLLAKWDCLTCLETESGKEKRDTILLSVLECLAETNVTPETLEMMVRTSEVMLSSVQAESNLAVRRRQEAMSNVTLILMLNNNLPGPRLYRRYREVRSCGHELERPVVRGLVTLLAHHRNNMVREAAQVYNSGVRWGIYSMQHLQRPLTLKLASNFTFEELQVITDEFFNKIENIQKSEDSLNLFVKMEEISAPNCGVRQLNCVRCKKDDAVGRLKQILKDPLKLQSERASTSVPFIKDCDVREHIARRMNSMYDV